MKSAEIDGKSDYKHIHLHFYIFCSINSFIGVVPLPSLSYDIIIISSNGNLDSYGNLHPTPTITNYDFSVLNHLIKKTYGTLYVALPSISPSILFLN